MNQTADGFSPDAFAARLRELRKVTGLTGASIAQRGGITKQTFSGYLHTGRVPSAGVLANWVFQLGINANWLLTGEGPMLLENTTLESDPLALRVAQRVGSLRQSGAQEQDILRSVLDLVEAALDEDPCAASPAPGAPVRTTLD